MDDEAANIFGVYDDEIEYDFFWPGSSSSDLALDDALCRYDPMLLNRPLPSIREFTKILNSIVRLKRYSTAISLINRLDLLRSNPLVKPDIYTFNIAINCFCYSNRVDLGFSILGNILKLGYEPDSVIYNTLIRGLCSDGEFYQAVKVFDQMVKDGLEPTIVTYGTLINGLCKLGNTRSAIILLKKMENSRVCPPGVVEYSTIIDSLCKDKQVTEALNIFDDMIRREIVPNAVTYTSLIQGVCNSELWEEAKKLLEDMLARNIPPDLQCLGGFTL